MPVEAESEPAYYPGEDYEFLGGTDAVHPASASIWRPRPGTAANRYPRSTGGSLMKESFLESPATRADLPR